MDGLGTALEQLASMRPPPQPPSGADDANKVWYLRQNRLFGEAAEAGIISTEHLFTMCEMPRGTRVFDQGDTTRTVYMVKRGACGTARETRDGKDVTVALLGAGDFFGEETLFDDRPRTTVAVVVEDALLCTVRADDLFALLASDPALALNVAKLLSGRLDDARATMEDLAYARVGDRIVHLYRKLAAEHGKAVAGATRVDLRLTHADVASLVASTREPASLEIAKLVEAARLRLDGRAVIVPPEDLP